MGLSSSKPVGEARVRKEGKACARKHRHRERALRGPMRRRWRMAHGVSPTLHVYHPDLAMFKRELVMPFEGVARERRLPDVCPVDV